MVEAALNTSLRETAAILECPLYSLLLASFNVLLYRLGSQADWVVEIPVPAAQTPPVAGTGTSLPFGSTNRPVSFVSLNTHCNGDASFTEFLREADRLIGDAQSHSSPCLGVQTITSGAPRDTASAPWFAVAFEETAVANRIASSEGLTGGSPVAFDFRGLSVEVEDAGGELLLHCRFNQDLFDPVAIKRWLGHWRSLLTGIAAHPGQRVSELPIMTEAERQQLLVEWNQTEMAYPRDRCVHELCEEQAANTPDAVALVYGKERLTFRQLNERANQLAHHLRGLGVGPNVLVGICVGRSIEMVIGLLGILKAGGAYVPMDPRYPKERLVLMLRDAQPRVLVTQQTWLKVLPHEGVQVVQLDTDWPAISRLSGGPADTKVTAENLAYVIYTSGTTGIPKGVALTHRGVVSLATWAGQVFTPSEFDGVLFSTSICFDLSVFELFVTLANGGKVILAQNVLELPALAEVRMINSVPSAIAELVRLNAIPRSVITVNLAGEPLAQSLVEQIYQTGGIQKVYDLYGPTETTTYSTFTLRQKGGLATIGRPIANTQVYLLDGYAQPVPVGVPGELHIGGVGLARGYHARPELNAEKFVANPFSTDSNARLYKTGDLARYDRDGNLEYLGRRDQQVKIRGFRIELGEIESQLGEHPAIGQAVVVARNEGGGENRLVGYVVPKQGAMPNASELRSFLQARLPEYMLPSAFVSLESLPLLLNGKIDRKALPNPTLEVVDTEFVPPTTNTEIVLAAVWRDVLKLKRVGVTDNYFSLGGHSLQAVRLISEINKRLMTELHVPAFFQNPTIRMLAQLLSREPHHNPETQLVSLQPGRVDGAVFYVEASMGLCRLAELFETGPASFSTIASLAPAHYRAALTGDLSKLPDLQTLAAPHAAMIQGCSFAGPCIIVGHSFGALLAFETAHQLQRSGRRVDLVLLLDGWGEDPTWQQKIKALTWKSGWESISFRSRRLCLRWKAKVVQLGSWLFQKSDLANGVSDVGENFHLPYAEADWNILSMINLKARPGYHFRSLECRAVLFRANAGEGVRFKAIDGRMGWGGLFKGGLEIVDCPGDHFSMLKSPNLQYLAQQFQRCIEKLPVASPAFGEASVDPSRQRK